MIYNYITDEESISRSGWLILGNSCLIKLNRYQMRHSSTARPLVFPTTEQLNIICTASK